MKEIIDKLIVYGIIDTKKVEGKSYTEIENYNIVNIIIEENFSEDRFFLFSYEWGAGHFLDCPEALDFISNPTELLIYDLAKFTNFFFDPKSIIFSYSENNCTLSFNQDGIEYFEEIKDVGTLPTAIKMINAAIQNRNRNNPLFYSLSLGEYFGFVLLNEEQHSFLKQLDVVYEPLW
ncbi:hypothetical protein [Bernardetia sp.]|uniref:hypothetical protein n=1 Tax=Bernardetia sp. TaxID=1937974 RepID=UPI0025C4F796|nr:hypothetical protein [Bernardetia sp.]